MSNLDLWRKSFGDIDSLFDAILKNDAPGPWAGNMKKAMAAKAEISEGPESYTVKFEVPGLKKEDIKIDLHDSRLTVSGERKEERKEEKDHKVHYSEMSYGSFMRSYTFPLPVDSEKIEATYDGGILKIQVAKSGAPKARQITIK